MAALSETYTRLEAWKIRVGLKKKKIDRQNLTGNRSENWELFAQHKYNHHDHHSS